MPHFASTSTSSNLIDTTQTNEEKLDPFSCLPLEIVGEILSFLNLLPYAFLYQRVCKSWQELLLLLLEEYNEKTNLHLHFGSVDMSKVTFNDLMKILSTCRNVKKITLCSMCICNEVLRALELTSVETIIFAFCFPKFSYLDENICAKYILLSFSTITKNTQNISLFGGLDPPVAARFSLTTGLEAKNRRGMKNLELFKNYLENTKDQMLQKRNEFKKFERLKQIILFNSDVDFRLENENCKVNYGCFLKKDFIYYLNNPNLFNLEELENNFKEDKFGNVYYTNIVNINDNEKTFLIHKIKIQNDLESLNSFSLDLPPPSHPLFLHSTHIFQPVKEVIDLLKLFECKEHVDREIFSRYPVDFILPFYVNEVLDINEPIFDDQTQTIAQYVIEQVLTIVEIGCKKRKKDNNRDVFDHLLIDIETKTIAIKIIKWIHSYPVLINSIDWDFKAKGSGTKSVRKMCELIDEKLLNYKQRNDFNVKLQSWCEFIETGNYNGVFYSDKKEGFENDDNNASNSGTTDRLSVLGVSGAYWKLRKWF
ncbi:hypothetical protein ABK040_011179 [Willaertia magna]